MRDSSGNDNDGVVSGARRTTGRFSGALRFDGVNDMVTVADAASLDLDDAMTLEAWVKPSALGPMWRTVVIKEQKAQLAYALYAGNGKGQGKPSAHVYTRRDKAVAGRSAMTTGAWTHLASTWDGRTLRLYINGSTVASAPLSRAGATSAKPLRFGGNAVWKEWFKGAIDEVRIYDHALTAAEIQADRQTPLALDQAPASWKPQAITKKAGKAKRGKHKQRKGKRRRAHATRWLH